MSVISYFGCEKTSCHMVTLSVCFIVVLALGALVTQIAVFAIERAYPPQGRLIDVRGGRIHVVDLGPRDLDEPPIVLIHGASANLESMRQPLGDLLAQRHRVLLVDRPGHGWSTRAALRDATPAIHADMIAEALEKLGVDQAILVGHSWGGSVLPAFAVRHPRRVAGLVMLAAVTHPWTTGVAWYHNVAATPVIGPLFGYTLQLPIALAMLQPGARGAFLPQAMPDGYVRDTATPLLVRPRVFLANGRDMITLSGSVGALQPLYRDIKAPTIVIHGDAERTVSIAIHARRFVSEVECARLIELPGVGHMVQNAAPEIVVEAIESLLPRATAAPAIAVAR
jgi:pimeloyl-ACP methyl ester carboxylesterase